MERKITAIRALEILGFPRESHREGLRNPGQRHHGLGVRAVGRFDG